jgi:hypothetical protein
MRNLSTFRFLIVALLVVFALSVVVMESAFAQEEGPPAKQSAPEQPPRQPAAEPPATPPAQPEQPVKPPAEQPKERPGLPTKPSKKDLEEKALFVITAGEELTVGQILEQIKKMTGKEMIPFPGVAEKRIRFVSTFKANYTILEKILNVNGIVLEHLDEPKMTIQALMDQQLPKRRYGISRVLEKEEEVPAENELVTAIIEVQYADPKMVEQTVGNRLMVR